MTELLEHGNNLPLPSCPHCGVSHPNLYRANANQNNHGYFVTSDHEDENPRMWANYICATCGGVVLAEAPWYQDSRVSKPLPITNVLPAPRTVSGEIPVRARQYLDEAARTLRAPSASLMVCASAVDAMLKEKGYKAGSLYARIEQAAKDHVITAEMADWAHHVRLEANDQRHADEGADLPDIFDAERCIEFALALAEFMFVLPARVRRGLTKGA